MKAILIVDIPDDYNIAEIRVNIQANCYGEEILDWRNQTLIPMPKKLDATEISMQCGKYEVSDKLVYQVEGYNRCIERILGEAE